MKKAVLLILILSLCFSFAGCKESAEVTKAATAVTVGDAEVDAAVFAYYLDTQIKTHGDGPEKSIAIQNAENLCAEYVKINTEFQNRELQLSASNKATIASKVDEIWRLYGRYYEKIGVTKDTITKVVTSNTYKDILITTVFGVGGDKEISDDKMKEYFNENYIFFKYFNAVLSGDKEADKLITDTFRELKDKIGKEDEDTEEEITFDDVYREYVESTGGTAGGLDITSMKKGTDTFPEQFFADVVAMKADEIKLLTYDDNVFLVQKTDGGGYFSDYKSSILEYLTNTDFEKLMTDNYGKTTVTGNAAVEEDCFNKITDAKVK